MPGPQRLGRARVASGRRSGTGRALIGKTNTPRSLDVYLDTTGRSTEVLVSTHAHTHAHTHTQQSHPHPRERERAAELCKKAQPKCGKREGLANERADKRVVGMETLGKYRSLPWQRLGHALHEGEGWGDSGLKKRARRLGR